MDEEIKSAVTREILSQRAQRYRRNVIALGCIIGAATILPFDDYSKFNIGGITFSTDICENTRKLILLGALWLPLLYSALYAGWLGWRDWQEWRHEVTKQFKGARFPEIRMFFGWPPSDTTAMQRLFQGEIFNGSWSLKIGPNEKENWISEAVPKHGKRRTIQFIFPINAAQRVRSRIKLLVGLDISVVIVILLIAIWGTYRAIF